MTVGGQMADVEQAQSVPRWAWKLVMRLGQLKRGEVYRLTLVIADGDPAWTVENVGKLENWREQPAG